MTAGELIDRLRSFDPALPVIMPGEDDDFCQVAQAFEDTACLGETGAAELADERDSGVRRVVRLFGPEGG